MSCVVKIQSFIVNDIGLAKQTCQEIGWQFSDKGTISGSGSTSANFFMKADNGYTIGLQKIKDTNSYNIVCDNTISKLVKTKFVFNYSKLFVETSQSLEGRTVKVTEDTEEYLCMEVVY